MGSYYQRKLSGERLRRCYEIAPPRVQRYLRAETELVLGYPAAEGRVLELGCGYGRVLLELARKAREAVGIDLSLDSLRLARRLLAGSEGCWLAAMDAAALAFPPRRFDLVVCIQNGVSAFQISPLTLVREAVRVTRPGGKVLVSTYTEGFWGPRLEWFRRQAAEGLIGEIDEGSTGEGVIVCRDGFRAGAVGDEELKALGSRLGLQGRVFEVDGSSLFLELAV